MYPMDGSRLLFILEEIVSSKRGKRSFLSTIFKHAATEVCCTVCCTVYEVESGELDNVYYALSRVERNNYSLLNRRASSDRPWSIG